ncbi:lipocalin/fatty acid-binding family protein [Pontiella sulfatireligans]|uniref:Restriction endonuclease type IV Mrr domain-containing protein n=1 Tax=Pontiella sulfatireligans TaxID=2750658 RepID=A0A6C2UKP0_9BACT|nr:hypothetical protein [Pontiella sulfatireligans]VGO19874.1 hypothetical protein SCARR_01934 [Pontiella sulfatireligans]
MLPDINFQNIRCHRNSKNHGFAELCVQIFRHTFPQGTTFYRVDDAGGDGGVEDTVPLPDGNEIGMQAKYFNSLGKSQWQQIDKSVRTAINNHPTLVEYRIVSPVNRGQDMKKWTDRINRWNQYAKEQGFTHEIEFVWWGESELQDMLLAPDHISKVHYWFGTPTFSFT